MSILYIYIYLYIHIDIQLIPLYIDRSWNLPLHGPFRNVVGLCSQNIVTMLLYGQSFGTQRKHLLQGVVDLWRWLVSEALLCKQVYIIILYILYNTDPRFAVQRHRMQAARLSNAIYASADRSAITLNAQLTTVGAATLTSTVVKYWQTFPKHC